MKFTAILLISLILTIGITSAYVCIDSQDNEQVKDLKYKINRLAFEEDVENGINPEALKLKLKYFVGCE